MARDGRYRSVGLVALFLTSILMALALPAQPVLASNETTEGTITTTETWTGVHTLTGDVTIATGAKLIIQPGSTITFPNGTHLDVFGSLCAGASSCGSNGDAGPGNTKITLRWNEPENSSARGECYGMSAGSQQIWIEDPSCSEGILMRSTIDLSQTELKHVDFDGPWGVPYYISVVGEFRYAALVLDGASPTLTELEFTDVNTSSIVATNLAQPEIIGGTFVVGHDPSRSIVGSALQLYSSGSSINPFKISDFTLDTGTNNGCQSRDGGRAAIWAEKSFVEIEYANISGGDFGIGLRSSAGKVTDSVINVNCNGIDINGKKSVDSTFFEFDISNNEITTAAGSGITVYSGGYAVIDGNDIGGAAQGSGITVFSSFASIHNNEIGPIDGFNGLWLIGSFDVIAENNSISGTARTPIVAGYYSQSYAEASRLFLANNSITYGGTGACSSNTYWDGDFTCPVVHAFMTGVTMYDNVIIASGTSDGIRAIGSLLDIQRNYFDIPETGAIVRNYDSGYSGSQQHGSLAFFSQNTWDGVKVAYNVTKSSVTAQSEYIPSPPSGEYPVKLYWPDQEAWPDNEFQGSIIPTPVKNCPNCDNLTPRNFPLSLNMDNNSTVFTFANLSNLDLSKIRIATQPTHFAVQVSQATLVRFQALIKGERVADATVFIEDALGNDLYAVKTESDGFTPWVALPSNFHLDFRGLGGGDNPDGFADDEFEDSCSDGIDNDGDLYVDSVDEDCNYAENSREMSLYRYTAYRFGFGYYRGEFVLDETSLQETANLENIAPTVAITELDGHSFRRVVNITGSAHDGQLANSYETDELARWDQRGYVHTIQVKHPFASSWEDAGLAIDSSGMPEGSVSRFKHPFSSWYFEFDMSSLAGEGDYVFQFRAFDGIDYSPVVTREFKLNTQAPTVFVSSPSSYSTHDDGTVHFTGSAQDSYGCPSECNKDVGLIYMQIEGPNFQVTTPIESDSDGSWEWTWDYTVLSRELSTFTFTVWASDSDFCIEEIDECVPVILTLSIDNTNSRPTISVNQPQSGSRVYASDKTIISGVARDIDGGLTKVDITAKDTFYDIEVLNSSAWDFSEDGEWSFEWDTTSLRHDSEYLIRVRSYDGLDYSDWADMVVTMDNPPDADNNKPQFNQNNWIEEFTLYCDTDSKSANRCTTSEINLMDFFSDLDEDIEYITVFNDSSISSDDDFGQVITVSIDGIARYNPTDMFFFEDDITFWSLDNVVFVATDAHDSKASSLPVSFIVVPLKFSIEYPDSDWVESDGIALYSGNGLPGKQVIVMIGGTPINNTVVSENGTWELGILGSRLKSGTSVPQFSYSGETTQADPIALGSPDSEESGIFGIGAFVIIVIIVVGALAYFFLEVEDDLEEELQKSSTIVPADLGSSSDLLIDDGGDGELERFDDHPGWLWNPSTEEWVPDPDFQE